MGFSVELFETIGWAESLLDAATEADVRRLPRLYAAAGYACFVGRAATATKHAHQATVLETPTAATSRASPATRRSSRRSDRSTAATSSATSS